MQTEHSEHGSFVFENYKKNAISRTDHCAWKLGTFLLYYREDRAMVAASEIRILHRNSQRLRTREWWQLFLFAGVKSGKQLMLPIVSSKVAPLLHLYIENARICFTRHEGKLQNIFMTDERASYLHDAISMIDWAVLPSMGDLLDLISVELDTSWGYHQTGYQNQIIYFQLHSGDKKRERACLRLKDFIKRNPMLRDTKTDSWTSLT